MIVGFVTGCYSYLFGLNVDVTTPIARAFQLIEPEKSDPAGWYAIFAAWLVFLFFQAPVWFYRDPKPEPRSNT